VFSGEFAGQDDSKFISIYHKEDSTLDNVGLQIWTGSILLCDFLLSSHLLFSESDILFEVGSGCGIVGVVAKTFLNPPHIFITDYRQTIVDLSKMNMETNRHLFQNLESCHCTACIFNLSSPSIKNDFNGIFESNNITSYSRCVFLAADMIYDDTLTIAMFEAFRRIMQVNDVLYMTIDKRFNFELKYMSVVAHGYDTFLEFVEISSDTQTESTSSKPFIGCQLDVELIPSRFHGLDRPSSLELWEITLRKCIALH
jgi:predicted nicotinamide N-methyase